MKRGNVKISFVRESRSFFTTLENSGFFIFESHPELRLKYKEYNPKVSYATSNGKSLSVVCLEKRKVIIRSSTKNDLPKDEVLSEINCEFDIIRILCRNNTICLLGFQEPHYMLRVVELEENYSFNVVFEKRSQGFLPLDISKNGEIIAYSTSPGKCSIFFRNDRHKKTVTIQPHTTNITKITISPNNNFLCTCSKNGTVFRIYDLRISQNEGKVNLVEELRRGVSKTSIFSLEFSPNSNFLSALGDTKTIHLFHLSTSTKKRSKVEEEGESTWINDMKLYLPYFGYNWSRKKIREVNHPTLCYFVTEERLVVFSEESDGDLILNYVNVLNGSILDTYRLREKIPKEKKLSSVQEEHSNKIPIFIHWKNDEIGYLHRPKDQEESEEEDLEEDKIELMVDEMATPMDLSLEIMEDETNILRLDSHQKKEMVSFFVVQHKSKQNQDDNEERIVLIENQASTQFWKLYEVYTNKEDHHLHLGFRTTTTNTIRLETSIVSIKRRFDMDYQHQRNTFERYSQIFFDDSNKEIYFVFGHEIQVFQFIQFKWMDLTPKEEEEEEEEEESLLKDINFGFCCCFDERRKLIYLYGGGNGKEFSDRLFMFDRLSRKWVDLGRKINNNTNNSKATTPGKRIGSSICLIGRSGQQILMFGGFNPEKKVYYNDLHIFDLKLSQWKRQVQNNPPTPRSFHHVFVDNEQKEMYVCSGMNSPFQNELDLLKFKKSSSSSISSWKIVHPRIPDDILTFFVSPYHKIIFIVTTSLQVYYLEEKKFSNVWKKSLVLNKEKLGSEDEEEDFEKELLESGGKGVKIVYCKSLKKFFVFYKGKVLEIFLR